MSQRCTDVYHRLEPSKGRQLRHPSPIVITTESLQSPKVGMEVRRQTRSPLPFPSPSSQVRNAARPSPKQDSHRAQKRCGHRGARGAWPGVLRHRVGLDLRQSRRVELGCGRSLADRCAPKRDCQGCRGVPVRYRLSESMQSFKSRTEVGLQTDGPVPLPFQAPRPWPEGVRHARGRRWMSHRLQLKLELKPNLVGSRE